MIQTSAAISPGSSGGGLFDRSGRLVGITTSFVEHAQNLNFAIPTESVMHLATILEPPPSSAADADSSRSPCAQHLDAYEGITRGDPRSNLVAAMGGPSTSSRGLREWGAKYRYEYPECGTGYEFTADARGWVVSKRIYVVPTASSQCKEIIGKIRRIPIGAPWTTAIVILGSSSAATDTPDGGTTYGFAFPECEFTEFVDTSGSGEIVSKRPYR
jgi:hypothetical protein